MDRGLIMSTRKEGYLAENLGSPPSPLKNMYVRTTVREKTHHFPHEDTLLPWKDHLQSVDQSHANMSLKASRITLNYAFSA